ncbi:hypothetical protein CHUAL_014041 [Chamberlinius hualienensis]
MKCYKAVSNPDLTDAKFVAEMSSARLDDEVVSNVVSGNGNAVIETDPPLPAEKKTSKECTGEAKEYVIKRCAISLAHSRRCDDLKCGVPRCSGMKRIVMHEKSCLLKEDGGCRTCKDLNCFSNYHSRRCQEQECLVPFCARFKNKRNLAEARARLQRLQRKLKRITNASNSSQQDQSILLEYQLTKIHCRLLMAEGRQCDGESLNINQTNEDSNV